jgi:tRNA-Thr(GGU) m(6)t(6)A37 methyltransferase TsaA
VIDRAFAEGLEDIKPTQEILLLTWFHLAERDVLKVHPRNDLNQPLKGVFSTRSPSRPNPIGLHRVRVLEVAGGNKLRVDHLDALHGTPIVDLKPVLDE